MLEVSEKYLEIITSAFSTETGIKIKKGKDWAYNTKSKTLYYCEDELKGQLPLIVKGLLLHEIGHSLFTTLITPTKLEKTSPNAFHAMQNVAEDIRLTHLIQQKYGSFAEEILNYLCEYSLNESVKQGAEFWHRISKLDQFLHLLFLEGLNYNFYTFRGLCLSEVTERFNNNSSKIGDIKNEIKIAVDSKQLQKIVDTQIYPLVEDWLKEFEQKQKTESLKTKCQGIGQIKISKNTNEPGNQLNQSLNGLAEDEVKTLLTPITHTVASRIANVLKEKRITRFQGNYKRGRLLAKNVYPNAPDYEFWVCLDASGSMKDRRGNNLSSLEATYLSALMIKAIAQRLNFTFHSWAFQDVPYKIDDLKKNYLKQCGGGTNDILALEQIEKEARTNPTLKDKILFFVTDGLCSGNTKPLMEKLERQNFTVLGISVGVTDPRGQAQLRKRFPNNLVIENPQDLPNALLSKLKSLIKR